MSPERRGMLLMALFVALWAAVEALAAEVLLRYSPYQVVWTRYVVHLAFMAAVWGWQDPGSLWRTRRPAFQIFRSMMMLGMPASWIVAMHLGVESGTLMFIFWASPLLILAFARFFLKERATLPLWGAALAAWAGAGILTGPSRPESLSMLAYPVAMAVTFSLYVVMTRSLRGETPRANLFHSALWVALLLTPAMPGLWITPSLPELLAMIGVGLLGFAALFALDRMAAAAPVSVSAPVGYLQLVFTISIAVLLGHGNGGERAAAGGLIIGAAVLYVWAHKPGLLLRNAA